MATSQFNHELLFNYLKQELPNDTVSINHPVDVSLDKGWITVLPLSDSLAGRYNTEEFEGTSFQITKYHPNFAKINKLDTAVRNVILNFHPVGKGNFKIMNQLHPKFEGIISLWQSILIICWYSDTSI